VYDLGVRFICGGRVEIEGEWRFGVSGGDEGDLGSFT
jgi:hypothetical protein